MLNRNREIANSNKCVSGEIVGIGEEVNKEYILNNIILDDLALGHKNREYWIHDLEFYELSYNCIGISALDIIKNKEYSFSRAIRKLNREIVKITNSQSGGIGFINFDTDMSTYLKDESDKEIIELISEFFNDLNMFVRKGCERPYVTFNFGLDESHNGRRFSKLLLKAYELGDENSKPFVFPNLVFKIKDGVNKKESDKNFDIFNLSCSLTAKNMIPTYLNCDSSLNKNLNASKLGIMGCRTRVYNNLFGEDTSKNRGNIACVTINLVQAAIKSNGSIDAFKEEIKNVMNKAKKLLVHRFNTLCKSGNFNCIRELGIYLDYDKSNKEMLRNGTLSIGFIGLWDSISVLFDKKLTKDDILYKYRDLAYSIVEFMKDIINSYKEQDLLNFSLLASAAEGVSGRFPAYDKEKYKEFNSKFNKEYYTNSFHVPVDLEVNYFEKLSIEGIFHKLCDGGSISYIELSEIPSHNIEGVKEIIDFACENDCNYIGINFPLDICNNCNSVGEFNMVCDYCGSYDILRLRRVSGYLSSTSNFTNGKKAELCDRVAHLV